MRIVLWVLVAMLATVGVSPTTAHAQLGAVLISHPPSYEVGESFEGVLEVGSDRFELTQDIFALRGELWLHAQLLQGGRVVRESLMNPATLMGAYEEEGVLVQTFSTTYRQRDFFPIYIGKEYSYETFWSWPDKSVRLTKTKIKIEEARGEGLALTQVCGTQTDDIEKGDVITTYFCLTADGKWVASVTILEVRRK